MQERLDFLGAMVAHQISLSSIITFASRMIFGLNPGYWVRTPILFIIFPLGFFLLETPEFNRPFLYTIQVSLMLVWRILHIKRKNHVTILIDRTETPFKGTLVYHTAELDDG